MTSEKQFMEMIEIDVMDWLSSIFLIHSLITIKPDLLLVWWEGCFLAGHWISFRADEATLYTCIIKIKKIKNHEGLWTAIYKLLLLCVCVIFAINVKLANSKTLAYINIQIYEAFFPPACLYLKLCSFTMRSWCTDFYNSLPSKSCHCICKFLLRFQLFSSHTDSPSARSSKHSALRFLFRSQFF